MGRGIQGEVFRRPGRSPSLNVRVTWSTACPQCNDKSQRSQTGRMVPPTSHTVMTDVMFWLGGSGGPGSGAGDGEQVERGWG